MTDYLQKFWLVTCKNFIIELVILWQWLLMYVKSLSLLRQSKWACWSRWQGKYVVNPSCGLILKGHPLGATGLAQCAELCWQLRGLADKRQVPSAKVALQHNLGLGGAVVISLYRLGFPHYGNRWVVLCGVLRGLGILETCYCIAWNIVNWQFCNKVPSSFDHLKVHCWYKS